MLCKLYQFHNDEQLNPAYLDTVPKLTYTNGHIVI